MEFDLTECAAVLERTPGVLRAMLADLPAAWTERDEGPETWSPFVIVGHLIHGERTDWIPRARIILDQGANRRFTGSYHAGDDFPATSWVADNPRALDPSAYRLAIGGHVRTPLQLRLDELNAGYELAATLDCTGGFWTTQRWHGTSLGRLIDEAGVREGARHVRVISHTGYRWSFGLERARGLLLATRVGGEPLSHGHGAPCRPVAPSC